MDVIVSFPGAHGFAWNLEKHGELAKVWQWPCWQAVFFFPTHKLMATVFIPCLLLLMAPITVVTVSISTDKNKVLAVVCQMEVEDRVCRKAKVQTPG